jgi:hypothetical protein
MSLPGAVSLRLVKQQESEKNRVSIEMRTKVQDQAGYFRATQFLNL